MDELTDPCPWIDLNPQGSVKGYLVCFLFARCGLYTEYSAHSEGVGLELSLSSRGFPGWTNRPQQRETEDK